MRTVIVGGLSQSAYFQQRMNHEFGIKSRYRLNVIIPKRPILSVIEGAAYFGITAHYIKARVLQYSYGWIGSTSLEAAMKRNIPEKSLCWD